MTYGASSSRNRMPLVIAAVVGVVAIVATFLVLRGDPGGEGDDTDRPDVTQPARDDCVPLELSSSTEKGDLLAELASAYHAAEREFDDGTCAAISVHKVTSGLAMESLARGWDEDRDEAPEPQVWTPTSSIWVKLLQQRGTATDQRLVSDDDHPSIAQSPLTIAMPQPMAEAMGWPDQQVTWSDILELSTSPEGWAARGHPEWGRFALGKDNPHLSTSGMSATIAAFYAATGLSSDLSADQVTDPEVTEFVTGVESGVLHYSHDAVRYMDNLYQADSEGAALSYVSAVAVQEQLVYLYNQGAPTGDLEQLGAGAPNVPLVAMYPDDGTLMLDHPFVVLPSADAEQQAAAADFLEFVQQPEQQQRFLDAGFRDYTGALHPDLAETINASMDQELALISPPAPDVVQAILDQWDEVRKKARVLLVMDVSGSMENPAGDGRTRLEAAKEAAISSLDLLHPDDEVGLWEFSTEIGGDTEPYRELLPPGRIGDTKDELTDAISGLHPEGGTALYHTIRAAHEHMVGQIESERINAVIVLSDGRNEYPRDSNLDALLRDVDAGDLELSVRIFPIAFGQDADLDELTAVAEASRTTAFDATDPATIERVFISVISNF